MRVSRSAVLVTAFVTAASVAALAPSSANAADAPPLRVVSTLSSAFVGPLQFAVDGKRIYVADSFTSTLNLIGNRAPLVTGPSPADGGDVAGVDVDFRNHAVAFTTSNGDHSQTNLTVLQAGQKRVVADLSAYERTANPDSSVFYGVRNPSQCVSDALSSMDIPVGYQGEVDSHPYAVVSLAHGSWAVADAGGNDILSVDGTGAVSTLAVLPSQPTVITAAFAAANGLPDCVIGITYRFEAVPTDVEIGPGGFLYVSTLPGGPEGPEGGARGSVYRIDRAGHVTRVATGFAGATNLAVDSHGNVFVAELSTGTVSEVVDGAPVPVLSLPGVVALEYANGQLYASTAPLAAGGSGPGQVVVLGQQ